MRGAIGRKHVEHKARNIVNTDRLNRDKFGGHAIFPCGREYSLEIL